MVYNNTTDKNGIIQEIERLTDLGIGTISGDTDRLKEFTTYANEGLDDIWSTIYRSCGNWQWDDSNQSDLPQATTDVVSGTGKYAIPTEALTIQRVCIKDTAGIWRDLYPITKEEMPIPPDEFYKTNTLPRFYRLTGDTIELKAAPNFNSTGGLKIYFDRASSEFAYNDTTKTPGFASPFHGLISFFASIFWMKIKQPTSPSLPLYINDYNEGKRELANFYSTRFKNKQPVIGRRKTSFR